MTIRLFTLHHQIYMSNGEEEDGEDGMGCAACAYHFFLTPMLAILFPLCIFLFFFRRLSVLCSEDPPTLLDTCHVV